MSTTTFIENELVFWKASGYVEYVKQVESQLAGSFSSNVWNNQSHVAVPVHLYGELAQTKEGIKLLEKKRDVEDFLGLLANNNVSSLHKRGALWALVRFFLFFLLILLIIHISNIV